MIKSELIQRLAEQQPHLPESDVEFAVNLMIDDITSALQNGGRVEIRGFGAFTARKRPARMARNPKTGETVQKSETYVPFFKAGKPLLDSVNK